MVPAVAPILATIEAILSPVAEVLEVIARASLMTGRTDLRAVLERLQPSTTIAQPLAVASMSALIVS